MKEKLLMTPDEVVEYAFAVGEYVGEGDITYAHIAAAQQRHIIPILGHKLFWAVAEGNYSVLRDEFIAPTLGILARIEAALPAYPPTEGERQRSKLFLQTLSDYLNSHEELYYEYSAEENVMNRCSIAGGIVL